MKWKKLEQKLINCKIYIYIYIIFINRSALPSSTAYLQNYDPKVVSPHCCNPAHPTSSSSPPHSCWRARGGTARPHGDAGSHARSRPHVSPRRAHRADRQPLPPQTVRGGRPCREAGVSLRWARVLPLCHMMNFLLNIFYWLAC